jgi:NADH:ubiquinone oxidoreductase subunit H
MVFALKAAIFFVCILSFAAYLSLFERKLIARIQMRLGPDKCGIFGMAQPIADALKLLFKSNTFSGHSTRSIVGVCGFMFLSIMQLTTIPLFEGEALLECNCKLLAIVLIHSAIVFFEILIGISSGSKFGVIGGMREYIQYSGSHIPFTLAMVYVMLDGNTIDLVANAKLANPLFAIVFFVTSLIAFNKMPFDFQEAESEIIGGTYIEYGGILFGMIYLSDYLNLTFISLLMAFIFFGGNVFATIIGSIIIIALIISIRATLARYRQDQMLKISWLLLTPTLIALILTFLP